MIIVYTTPTYQLLSSYAPIKFSRIVSTRNYGEIMSGMIIVYTTPISYCTYKLSFPGLFHLEIMEAGKKFICWFVQRHVTLCCSNTVCNVSYTISINNVCSSTIYTNEVCSYTVSINNVCSSLYALWNIYSV